MNLRNEEKGQAH